MLASCMMDPVLGLDTHIVLVPTPGGPVPTPLPMPFIGMVFDPIGLAMGMATGSLTLVNGMLATNVGTAVTNKITMPHLPIPGPFAVPPGMDAEIKLGSLNVSMGGCFGARLGDLAWSCGDPEPAPTSVVLAIPKGPLVLVLRPPAPDLEAMAMNMAIGAALHVAGKILSGLFGLLRKLQHGAGAGFFKKISSFLHFEGAEGNFLKTLWNDSVCFLTGHPVDVATGRLITSAADLDLPGRLALRFERRYDSCMSDRSGPLGAGWSHNFNQAVWPTRGAIVLRGPDGREVEFSTLQFPDYHLMPGRSIYNPIERLTLSLPKVGHYRVQSHDGTVRDFIEPPNSPGRVAKLARIQNRLAEAQRLTYDERGQLDAVFDPAGRSLRFTYDNAGRLGRLDAYGTDGQGQHIAAYAYSPEGDLIQVNDALGNPFRYEYVEHLLVQETNRNGLSFYFQYDGVDSTARCVRTWGDGGIYDHVITYDTVGKKTLVENSLGAVTLYQLNDFNQVISIVDALGGETKFEYEHITGQKTKEVDPMGAETVSVYDERGNLIKTVNADGAELTLEYNESNQLTDAIDAIGGHWRWGYDQNGRLIGRANPLAERTQFQWEGALLIAVVDPRGQQTVLGYDSARNLTSLTTPDGAVTGWSHDGFGRLRESVDLNGNRRVLRRDALGRAVHVTEPDGNQRTATYDNEGNVTRIQDRQYDVSFAYQGMNRLAVRTQAETRVEFRYDTEDQLVAIRNEHGFVYRFVLGPTGEVDEEWGFDDLRRRYVRDAAGRATLVGRPQGKTTNYAYDATGRVIGVQYDDGSSEAYVYRIDGSLIKVENSNSTLEFERDALGRITREISAEGWVQSEFDALGMRSRMQSSKGLVQRVRRSAMGDVLELDAHIAGGASASASPSSPGSQATGTAFAANFERDRLGLELERSLPGGIRARWKRDALGRPERHEIWRGGDFQDSKQYFWDVSDRLIRVISAMTGPIDYTHDALGYLTTSAYADGSLNLRLPDAVGNLFRTADRSDRKYGAAGQLLEASVAGGVVRYEYDAEGNLTKKTEPDGSSWLYVWNGAGMLARVVRPNGHAVEFEYDALARRIAKRYRGKTTRWLWDRHVPLHEWVERAADAVDEDFASEPRAEDAIAAGERALKSMLVARPANGPPEQAPSSQLVAATSAGTVEAPITWLFEPERFSPLAKLVGGERFGMVIDHMGAPLGMFDDHGREVWGADIDASGELRNARGDRQACPFRWPGQYEDAETGLRYNRFRYYEPSSGYISQDPIRLESGVYNLYLHVRDPLIQYDPLGLDWNYFLADANDKPYYHGRASDTQTPADVARRHSGTTGKDGARFGDNDTLYQTTAKGTDRDAVRGIEQRGVEEGSLLGRGNENVRGNKIAGMSAEKQATPQGKARLRAADDMLEHRNPSEMPKLSKLEFKDLCKK